MTSQTTSTTKHILVIGAGVIGLQCAYTLLTEGKGSYEISIVAEHMPGDDPGIYASAWAGAQWRSHESSYTEAAGWDVQTYRYWRGLVNRGEGKNFGIAAVKGKNYWASLKASTTAISASTPVSQIQQDLANPDPWWSKYVDSYKRIDKSELPPDTVFGVEFDTFTIDVQTYLAELRRRIEQAGANLGRARLPTDQGLQGAVQAAKSALGLPEDSRFDAVVNASGMQAQELVGDHSLYPIRGQTVQVKGVAEYCVTRLGHEENDRAAIMPRVDAGVTIIGVTVEPNVWSTEVDEARVPQLLQAAKPYCPELLNANGDFEVISVGVGIRPSRKGGARIELIEEDDLTIVHAYGVGGAGYQNSVGLAHRVFGLLQAHFT